MTVARQERPTDACRILLFARNGTELLVLKRPGGICLPVLHIPRYERIAASLNSEAKRTWNLETVCVAVFSVSQPGETSGALSYHVMEVRRPEDLARIAPKTLQVAALEAGAFSDVRDYRAVCRAMKLDGDSPIDPVGPFSGFGAFERISAWVEEQLGPLGRNCDRAFYQLQGSGSFALIRFGTRDGAVWFKATGQPNQKELAITGRLAALFPNFLPELIAVREDWNAWLTNEVAGKSLDSGCDLAAWCSVAASLAELQVASINHTPSILSSGANDARTVALYLKVAPFFAQIERLMDLQTKTSPRKLCTEEIRFLRDQVREALGQMSSAAIPDTLNHFDLNPANIVVCSNRCKFLDWAEAAVGHPFFSFEYLRQQFLGTFGGELDAETEFRRSYVNVWRKLLPDRVITLGLELMPLLGPFAYAVTALPWNAGDQNTQTEFAGLLRSLARRMHQEAGFAIPAPRVFDREVSHDHHMQSLSGTPDA